MSPRSIGPVVLDWVNAGFSARLVRGRKMRTRSGLFDEFSAALQFPPYFGENRDAFDECIRDLENLPSGRGYVVAITEPEEVLRDELESVFGWFANSLAHAAESWSSPIALGEAWDRPSVPFHTVLVGKSRSLERAAERWAISGLETRNPGER
ncbi:barstar family protein [Tessaracoccus terricola]